MRFARLAVWFQSINSLPIEAIIGAEMPHCLTNVKDYCTEQGLSFGSIKTSLQAEVDKLQ